MTTQYLAYLSGEKMQEKLNSMERKDSQGLISMGNHRFMIPGLVSLNGKPGTHFNRKS